MAHKMKPPPALAPEAGSEVIDHAWPLIDTEHNPRRRKPQVIIGRDRLTWRDDALYCGQSQQPLAHVIADPTWPDLWRVRTPDDCVSDLTNLSRARDAAVQIALLALNLRVQDSLSAARRCAINGRPA